MNIIELISDTASRGRYVRFAQSASGNLEVVISDMDRDAKAAFNIINGIPDDVICEMYINCEKILNDFIKREIK
jgi:putative cofactor-binding repeat protein